MSNVLFCSDLHLGHKNICKYRTHFANEKEHRDTLYENYHSKVTKRDKVFFLGDVCFSQEALDDLSGWAGTKVLILGNHCVGESGRPTLENIAKVFTGGVFGLYKYKEFWLSHAPIHPDELRGKKNLHGHTHSHNIEDSRYFNCSMENINYTPISLFEVRGRMTHE